MTNNPEQTGPVGVPQLWPVSFSEVNMKIKVGLIGVSGYGRTHFSHLRKLFDDGSIELSAAAVINPDQVPNELAVLKQMGSAVFPSADAMFDAMNGKLDLVCIPTGIPFHEKMTVRAHEIGANVLVEKPAASSSAAVSRMMESEKRSGHFAAVGFQHIYAREIQFIKKYLVSGRLGSVRRVFCCGIWPRNDSYYARNNWAGKIAAADGTPILDSPINNAFAHYLNLELFLAGSSFETSAHAVSVEGSLYRARKNIETFDTCTVRFTTDGGIPILTLLSHTAAQADDPMILIECENGSVYWKVNDSWNICSMTGKLLYSGVVEPPHTDMFRDVIDKASGRQVFCCPLSVAAEHTHCIEMLSGKLTPVELNDSITRIPENGQLVLDRVESVFTECLRRKALPAEIGITWK